jgi:hypothetical protein
MSRTRAWPSGGHAGGWLCHSCKCCCGICVGGCAAVCVAEDIDEQDQSLAFRRSCRWACQLVYRRGTAVAAVAHCSRHNSGTFRRTCWGNRAWSVCCASAVDLQEQPLEALVAVVARVICSSSGQLMPALTSTLAHTRSNHDTALQTRVQPY